MTGSTAGGRWPEDLPDLDAILRFQDLMLAACEGTRNDEVNVQYKSFRTQMIGRDDLADVVPDYIKRHRDLLAFWPYIKSLSPQWEPRRVHIRETFAPMLDRVEGRTKPPIRSGSWTGKRTPAEQARVVISLAPCALEGVEQLLSEFERTLHNGGPVDPERSDAIRALKELRTAITELIDVAETGQLVAANLASLRILKSRTFRWSRETYSLAVAGLPLTTASTVVGCGVMMLVDVLGKGSAEAAAIGVGAMGVHAVAASKRVASN